MLRNDEYLKAWGQNERSLTFARIVGKNYNSLWWIRLVCELLGWVTPPPVHSWMNWSSGRSQLLHDWRQPVELQNQSFSVLFIWTPFLKYFLVVWRFLWGFNGRSDRLCGYCISWLFKCLQLVDSSSVKHQNVTSLEALVPDEEMSLLLTFSAVFWVKSSQLTVNAAWGRLLVGWWSFVNRKHRSGLSAADQGTFPLIGCWVRASWRWRKQNSNRVLRRDWLINLLYPWVNLVYSECLHLVFHI